MERYLIGIDVGTTGTKSMVVSEDGRILGHAYRGYGINTPNIGFREQNPEDWWNAVVETVREAVGDEGNKVVGISLSAQGGTLVPVDENIESTYPAIVWSDQRATVQKKEIESLLSAEYVYTTTGYKVSSGLNALQIKWIKDNCPEVFEKTKMFLSVPDFVSARMTGKALIDISDAGINLLADIKNGVYDKKILGFSGIDESQLADIVPSGTVIGKILPDVAKQLGINPDAVLVAGAHDQYAATLGAGVSGAGDIMIGTGTAWVITALLDAPDFSTGFSHAISATGQWGCLTSMATGGVSLDWYLKKIMGAEDEKPDYAFVDKKAGEIEPGCNGLFFFPYFAGARFPLNDEKCKGTFVGLDLSHDKYHLARAVMEGIVFQTAWMLESFNKISPIRSLRLTGGASKSPFWVQMVADVTGCSVRTPSVTDLTCVGAAVLAGVGSGVFASSEAGVKAVSMQEKIYNPIPENAAKYAGLFAEYKRIARTLSNVYSKS